MTQPINLPRLWHDMLQLCKLAPTEHVVVLDSTLRPSPYAALARQTAEVTAASVALVEVGDANHLPPSAVAAIGAADLLIDLAFSHDLRVSAALEDGLRVLVAIEPPEILARMFPTLEDKRRCVAARQRFGAASTMRVTSAAGTDFRCALGEFKSRCQYGFADEPGRWDQWPGAFVTSNPDESSSHGTVVLDRGDMLFPMKSYIRSPIRLTVADGFITAIEGGLDADYLSDVLNAYHDPDVFAVSHLGWGLSHNGQWNALGLYDRADTEGQDGRAFYGNFLFSTGPNNLAGGKRATPCHIDIPMRRCTVALDGEAVVVDGEVMADDQKAARVGLAAE
jgi:2,5-dihydroxypyridine 5,6-dioxygenase